MSRSPQVFSPVVTHHQQTFPSFWRSYPILHLFVQLFAVIWVVYTVMLLWHRSTSWFKWFHQSIDMSEGWNRFFLAITQLGTARWIAPICGVLIAASLISGWTKGARVMPGMIRTPQGEAFWLTVSLSQFGTLFVVQVFKRIIHAPRPSVYYAHKDWFHAIPWPESLHSWNSFPSGHTAGAFALATLLCWALSRAPRGLAVLCLLLASLVGFSRVYLGQHFPADVWLGSLLGVGVSTLILYARWSVAVKRCPAHSSTAQTPIPAADKSD